MSAVMGKLEVTKLVLVKSKFWGRGGGGSGGGGGGGELGLE